MTTALQQFLGLSIANALKGKNFTRELGFLDVIRDIRLSRSKNVRGRTLLTFTVVFSDNTARVFDLQLAERKRK